jgi:type III pantothenate kinase
MSVIPPSSQPDQWIALAIGNSRLHWGLFCKTQLQQTCHTPHLNPSENGANWQKIFPFLQPKDPLPDLWVASVVPSQTQLCQHYPHVTILERSDIPLQGMYPTLGLDRTIALWSAGITYGWPTLVIDGGTALTFTGADAEGCLVGGAITETAMQSGVLYGAIAGLTHRIEQWQTLHPTAYIILTGGDAETLSTYLNLWHQPPNRPEWIQSLHLNAYLLLQGIAAIRSKKTT